MSPLRTTFVLIAVAGLVLFGLSRLPGDGTEASDEVTPGAESSTESDNGTPVLVGDVAGPGPGPEVPERDVDPDPAAAEEVTFESGVPFPTPDVNSSENYTTMWRLYEDFQSEGREHERVVAISLMSRTIATILDARGQGEHEPRSSMRTEEGWTAIAVNGGTYRFEDTEFPEWGEYMRFTREASKNPGGAGLPLPEELRTQILESATHALTLEQAK